MTRMDVEDCDRARFHAYNVWTASPHAWKSRRVSAVVAAINTNSTRRSAVTDRSSIRDAANRDAIATLAEETHQPFDVVKGIYEEQFARLSAEARVTDYLVLFASRRTRAVLANRRT